MKNAILLILALIISGFTAQLWSQKDRKTTVFETGTIEKQFNYVIYNSTTYDDYKAVKITWLYNLKKRAVDSVKTAKALLHSSDSSLTAAEKSIADLQTQLDNTKQDLAQVTKEKNSFNFFGALVAKSTYNAIMWIAIIALATLGIFAFLFFKRSNAVTARTKKDLEDLREEFENHRKRAREREEKIVVEYHNEINKYKKQLGTSL